MNTKLKGIPKLVDANYAGTDTSQDCTLILTEGDSSKSMVMVGISVVGRDHYGVFPLTGIPLNVRSASPEQVGTQLFRQLYLISTYSGINMIVIENIK